MSWRDLQMRFDFRWATRLAFLGTVGACASSSDPRRAPSARERSRSTTAENFPTWPTDPAGPPR